MKLRARTMALAAIVLLGMPVLAGAGQYTVTNDVAFTARVDGTTQRYVELRPEGFDPAKVTHLAIALHGHGSDRWQFVRDPRDECRGARDVAAKYGMLFVSPDYRAATSWMGPQAEADMVQIIGDLRAQYKIGKVFLVGASMGGSAVLTFTALHPDLIAGVSSQNGTANHLEYENFQDAIQASFGGAKAAIPLEYKKRSAEYWPEAFTMPTAITCSGKDTAVPPDSVLRLARTLQKLGRPVLLLYRPERGHATDYADTTAALEFVITNALGLAATPPAPAAVAK